MTQGQQVNLCSQGTELTQSRLLSLSLAFLLGPVFSVGPEVLAPREALGTIAVQLILLSKSPFLLGLLGPPMML